ncbi:MAG: hypothetical protein Q8M15_14600 [Bacteroidota bacterium]|nr:hypothetical protein [Bacteroidota bacterium]
MINLLTKKYKQNDHFFFKPTDRLSEVCNAPKDSSGVYVIYALEKGKVNLIYIGISGRKNPDGNIQHRKDGLRGRFLTGKQFGDLRQKTWPAQMKFENIDGLDIYWFVTHGKSNNDFPRDIEIELLKKYQSIHGTLPRWNKEI